jgi:hypothetical protein
MRQTDKGKKTIMHPLFRYRISSVFFVLILISGFCSGYEVRKHDFEIGPEFYYFDYTEYQEWILFGIPTGIDETVMDEDGLFYGVTGAYTFRGLEDPSNGGIMLRAEGRFASGVVDYDGQTQGGVPLTITDIDDYTMEFRGLIGHENLRFDYTGGLYAGFGYRYLNDDLSEFSGGYERESNYYYIPIGITGTGPVSANGWSSGLTFEFDFLLRGLQKTHLSDTGYGYSDFENKQKKGWGLRGSIKFIKNGNMDFIIEPFARFWSIDDSEVTVIEGGIPVYEPRNESVEAGVNIIIKF